MYITLPCSIFLAQKSIFDHSEKNNEIYQKVKGPRLTGKKVVSCTSDLDITQVLEVGKKTRAFTLNDFIISVLALTLRQATTAKLIQLSVPFTLRPFPKASDMTKESDMTVKNDFASVPIVLNLARDFEGDDKQVFTELMSRIRKETRSAKF
jgi:hypothetical protein